MGSSTFRYLDPVISNFGMLAWTSLVRCTFLVALFLALACTSLSPKGLQTVESFSSQLECGMRPETVWRILNQRADDLGSYHFWLGRYVIREDSHEIWFDFQDGGLRTIVFARDYGFKNRWLSPKVDLCTGQLLCLLELIVPPDLEGASVSVDGEIVSSVTGLLSRLTLTMGTHKLQLISQGGGSIVEEIVCGDDNKGNIRLTIRNDGEVRRSFMN